MDMYTPAEKLDAVLDSLQIFHLEYIKSALLSDVEQKDNIRVMVGVLAVRKDTKERWDTLSGAEVTLILNKLIDDHYCYYIQPEDKILYGITFLGLAFCETGGYRQKALDSTSSNRRIESLEKRTYRVTFWMAFAAIALLIWEFVKYYFPKPWDAWIWLKSIF